MVVVAESLDRKHHDAIEQARSGQYEAAIAGLDEILRAHPDHAGALLDLAVILSWSGQDAAALDAIPARDSAALPDYALRAFAQSARNVKSFDQAQSYYQVLIARDPQNVDYALGLALIYIDIDDFDAADKILQRVHARDSRVPATLSVVAYYYRKQNELLEAANYYQKILRIDPEHREAFRQRSLLAAALGAPDQALLYMRERPSWFSSDEKQRVAAHAAALRIRWGSIEAPSEQERFVETDDALARLDALQSSEEALANASSPLQRQLLFDRLVALRDRVYPQEVVKLYEGMRDRNIEIPSYALLAVGDAYLYLEEPDIARDIYQQVVDADPEHFEARRALYYAQLESEDFSAAYQQIDDLVASEARWHTSGDGKIRKPNERRLRAEAESVLARAFGDDLAYAEAGFDELIDAAPLNTGLWANRAAVYRWRGWPRRARDEAQAVMYLEPEFVGAELVRSHASLDTYRFTEVAADAAALTARLPENKHVQALQRRWLLHNRRELISRFTLGESSGGTERGSDYTDVESWLYSQPLNRNYRAYLHHLYSSASFPEGDGLKHRVGVGLEYRRHDPMIRASVEVLGGFDDHDDVGLGATVDWSIDDYWRLGGGIEVSSPAVPLRGLRQGVRGNRVYIRGAHRWHESQEVRGSYSYLDFDDGNRRHSLLLEFERRLINLPTYKLTGIIEAYASNNNAKNRIYYNPEQDGAIGGVLINTHRVYRRYEREFVHRLLLGGGFYAQRDFDDGHTWTIAYEHHWKFSNACKIHYGIRRARRVYDGNAEFENAVYGGLGVLF